MISPPKRDFTQIVGALSDWIWLLLVMLLMLVPGWDRGFLILAFFLIVSQAVQSLKVVEEIIETRYEITDDELILRFGRKRLRIPLDRVVSVGPAQQTGFDMSWSRDGLGVAYRCRRSTTDHVRISPSDPVTFLETIQALSPHLERRDDALVRKDTILPPTIPPNRSPAAVEGGSIAESGSVVDFACDRDFSFCAQYVYWPAVAAAFFVFWLAHQLVRNLFNEVLSVVFSVAIACWLGHIAYRLLRTSSCLADDTLEIRCGRSKLSIPLAAIREIYPFPQFKREEHKEQQWCWVWNPLRIDYRANDGSSEWVLIGPRFREGFLDTLQARDPALIRCGDVLFRVESDGSA